MPAVDVLLEELRRRGGSDLHLAVQHPPRARVNGRLVILRETPLSAKDIEDLLLEILSPLDRARFATGLDHAFAYEQRSGGRFRARYFTTEAGIAAVFRSIPAQILTAADLELPEAVLRLARVRTGLVLVAGPASSGKSVTAGAIIERINRARACHVVTVEEPIEFVFASKRAQITQRAVGEHVTSTVSALENIQRDDADVVLVPRLATPAEIELALTLSTSALVLTTVEATSRVGALDRLLQVAEPERRSRLAARLGQRIVAVIVHERVRREDGSSTISVSEVAYGPAASALNEPAAAASKAGGDSGAPLDPRS